MEAPVQDGFIDKIVIPIVIACVGWFIALLVYAYDQGRQGQKVKDLDEKVEENKHDFVLAIDKLEKTFFDEHGDSRLMPVSRCTENRGGCSEKFGRIEKKMDLSDEKTDKTYNELFDRVRAIEINTTEISTILRVFKTYPRPLSEVERPKKTVETYFSRGENEED